MGLFDQISLRVYYILHDRRGVVCFHRLVVLSSHTHSEVRLVPLGALDSMVEELGDLLLVLNPRPAPVGIVLEPLVGGSLHGLMMRCRDDDAVLIRCLLVFCVVDEEGTSWVGVPGPHGRPHEICLEHV